VNASVVSDHTGRLHLSGLCCDLGRQSISGIVTVLLLPATHHWRNSNHPSPNKDSDSASRVPHCLSVEWLTLNPCVDSWLNAAASGETRDETEKVPVRFTTF